MNKDLGYFRSNQKLLFSPKDSSDSFKTGLHILDLFPVYVHSFIRLCRPSIQNYEQVSTHFLFGYIKRFHSINFSPVVHSIVCTPVCLYFQIQDTICIQFTAAIPAQLASGSHEYLVVAAHTYWATIFCDIYGHVRPLIVDRSKIIPQVHFKFSKLECYST